MPMPDHLVERVMARSGIASRTRRNAVERELRNHIEDVEDELRQIGCDDEAIAARVEARFGDPVEIATAFSETYKVHRVATHTLVWSLQLIASFVGVSLVISSIQMVVGLGRGADAAMTFARMRLEVFGFAALSCGYVGSSLVDRATNGRSLAARAGATAALVAVLAAALTATVPGHVLAPAIACACAATVRFLERRGVRYAPLLGTAGPMLSAWALVGPVVVGNGHISPAVAPIIVTLDVAAACQIMSWLAAHVERWFTLAFEGAG